MPQNINQTLSIIQNTRVGTDLLAVKDHTFFQVGTFGRLFRWLNNLISHKSFEDCKSIYVVQEIAAFAQENEQALTTDQKSVIIAKLKEFLAHAKKSENKDRINDYVQILLRSKESAKGAQSDRPAAPISVQSKSQPEESVKPSAVPSKAKTGVQEQEISYANRVLRSGSHKIEAHQDFLITRVSKKEGQINLEFAKGDIAGERLGQVDAVVNAANGVMFYGGGGTNAALSKAFDKQEWESQAKALGNKLEVSEVKVFDFKPKAEGSQNHPKFLFQALGPVLTSDDLDTYKEQVYQTYKNIFAKCRELQVKSILIPLLSSGIFAGAHQNNPAWHKRVEEALFQAMAEELEQANSPLETIKIIDYLQLPFKETLSEAYKLYFFY